mgnify:FL=1
MSNKQKKIFKTIIIALAIILIGEIIYFGIRYYNGRKNSTYYSVINNAIVENEKNYVGAGFSDYKQSKYNDYEDGLNKATIFNYKDRKITKEVGFKKGYNSYFNDIIKVKDGYLAVGSIEMTKKQKEDGLSEGLLIKYDKNFNFKWRKNIRGIGKTELLKIKQDGDDFVIVGTSVYGEGYMGNHTTGGGILIKINENGEEIMRVNNGGPFYGRFNDVLIENNSYVVVGLGKANSGIIIKYTKDGEKVWTGSYGYTDKNGINSITKLGNKYITATTKLVNPKEPNMSAALVVFNKNGKKVDDVKYNSQSINYFGDVETLNDSIIAVGYTGKGTTKIKTDAIIVKYDKDLYEEETNTLKGDNNEYYNNIYIKDNKIIALGYSNSKSKEYKINGYDYLPITKTYNENLK